MFITAMGLIFVGVSSFLSDQSNSSSSHLLVVGICFILAGQFCNAVQMVIEESWVKNKGVSTNIFSLIITQNFLK